MYRRLRLAPKFILGMVPLLVVMAVAITLLPDLFVKAAEHTKIQESKAIAEQQADLQTFLAKHITGERPEDPNFTIKYTSDKYRNAKDMPDAWEKKMLQMYVQNPKLAEFSEVLDSNGLRVLRYSKPLFIQEACLACHGEPKGQKDPFGHEKEGYKVGEFRGAISVATTLEGLSKEKVALINTAVTLVVLLLTVIVMYMMVQRFIGKPLEDIVVTVKGLSEGDLTTRVKDKGSADEIGELTALFNQMIENQAKMVGTVRKTAVELAESFEKIATSSDHVSRAASEVADNIQHVARDASTGNGSIADAVQMLHDLSQLIGAAKEQALAAAEKSRLTSQAAESGKDTINETVACMEKIKHKTMETEDHISTLSEYSQQIGMITDTITSLANQTNLLALNAAIEAARAGEMGRGFAVVADEVRKLAEQSNRGAGEVAALVRKIADSTAAAVKAMQQSRSEVEQGACVVNKAGDVLEEILKAVTETVQDVEAIAAMTDREVDKSTRMVEVIQSLHQIIENTAANAEEVAASTEETSAAMETIANSAEKANAMAEELKKTVSRFKV
ncbi:methyl-accepting chemotaxis protein [Heliomicrobium modesticaldum Ice1]|uniref:Methyl-accepting chemotaxis protein n=1 Tax=Heliobacterium modesticaldum (strain ATCC 51547 / Ice1) TaxID=498761 RepID=B0TEK6_HELMI|nr:methyl-accepting chemotaxis protein [Heliomicrobium modesticaldum]ABZ82925.1 methyl-accepting chemotaxis protein [Heliomicrobium modesticaldum Ice1]